MSDLNSSEIVRVETTCELCGKQGDLAHGIFVCGPCCETGEEKRLRARIRELEAQLKTAEAALRKAHDALIWCSGASDFNPDGKAREGWIKIALPAFEVISSALCNEAQAKGETVLPKCRITTHPGELLKDEIRERGWSQARLAELLGYTPAYVSDVISGRRGLSAEGCIRCSEVFGTSPDYWWNLQCSHDLTKALNTRAKKRKGR